MKLYLLILALFIAHFQAFRLLKKDTLPIAGSPDHISYLGVDLLATQTGASIVVYNLTTNKVVQTFTSDTDTPDMQVSPQTGMILFKNNKSIFQLQHSKNSEIFLFASNETYWVFGLAAVSNIVISYELNRHGGERIVNYFNTSTNQIRQFYFRNSSENVLQGSQVVALSAEEYYFACGGICDNNLNQAVYFFFQGDSKQIRKIGELKVPGCIPTHIDNQKRQWQLSSVENGNANRLHAVTYVLDQKDYPRLFTTQILTSNTGFTSEWIRFDTNRLIGVDFVGTNLYTADDLLCRVVHHIPANYDAIQKSDFILSFNVLGNIVSQDEKAMIVLTPTSTAYLYDVSQDGSYSLAQTLEDPKAQVNTKACFTNNTLLLFQNGAGNLKIYDSSSSLWSTPTKNAAIDFCFSNDYIFTAVKVNNIYELNVGQIQQNGDSLDIVQINSLNLQFTVNSILCLDDDSVLINPINPGEPIAIWKYTNTFTNTANLIKLKNKHDRAYKTSSGVFFTNVNNYTTPLFYDLSLTFIATTPFLISPLNIYQVIPTGSDTILVAVGDDPSNLAVIDSYELFSNSLIYMGSFPLVNNGSALLQKIVVLPNSDKLSISYEGNSLQTMIYNLTLAPQQLRGHFYDTIFNDCSGYKNALFRLNSNTNNQQLIVINGLQDVPTLERYSFSTTGNTLTLAGSSAIENYIDFKLNVKLSPDKQSVLVSGLKQGSSISDTIQTRNANNLKDVTFQKAYFDQTEDKDIQGCTVMGGTVYSDIIYTKYNGTQFVSEFQSYPATGGKVSTDGQITDISAYSTCGSCSFMAITGNNLPKIVLVNINTGVTRETITTPCPVNLLSLSNAGTQVAYLCANGDLYVYDTTLDKNFPQGSGYTSVTEMHIVSSSDLVLINNGLVVHIAITLTSIALDIRKLTEVAAGQNSTVAVNNNQQLYAFSPDPQTVQINNFQGQPVDTFKLNSSQKVTTLAFSPNNLLSITTNTSNLITLTSAPCADNSTQTNGVCVCNPTFETTGYTCQCSAFMSLSSGKCVCDDGQFFVSETQCQDCSVMCHTCSGSGVSGCDKYGALFIVLVLAVCLIVIGAGIMYFIKTQKTSKLEEIKTININKSNQQSSGLLQEPLVRKENEQKQQ